MPERDAKPYQGRIAKKAAPVLPMFGTSQPKAKPLARQGSTGVLAPKASPKGVFKKPEAKASTPIAKGVVKQAQRALADEASKVAAMSPKNRAKYVQAHQAISVPGGYSPDHPFAKDLIKKGYLRKDGKALLLGQQYYADASAPVLEVLDQTTRPLHAVAGAADAAITGKNIGRAAKRGIQNKDKVSFSKVLKDVGAPKSVQAVGGFVGDVALDPTTYVTFGAGSVAKKAAIDAAEKAAARAAKAGMSEEGAATVARQAAKRAGASSSDVKGLTVKVAGHEVPGVRKATAATVGRIGRKAGKTKPVESTKNLVRDVRPTLAPAGVGEDEFAKVHDAAAAARAQDAGARQRARVVAQGTAKRIPKNDRAAVIDAIEGKKIGSLPEHLRKPAIAVRSELRYAKRKAIRSGLAVKNVEKGAVKGEAKGYYPHALDEALRGGEGIKEPVVERVGRGAPKTGSMKKRTDRRPISAINAETPGKVSTDIPLTIANHVAALGTASARAKFNRTLADAGRSVHYGDEAKAGEALYVVKGGSINRVRKADSEVKGGRYVAINEKLAESELATLAPIREKTAFGHAFNKGNQVFKRLATMTPGFHVRNAIGDTQMAYLSQPGHRLVGNTIKSARLLKEARRQEKSLRKLEPVTPSGKTVKIAGRRVPVEDALKGAQNNAAHQTGYIGRELNDLVGRRADGSVKRVGRGRGRLTRAMQDRENLMRGATYLDGLHRGMTPDVAGRLSRGTHIDYGDLTTFERQARRLLPFYTFSARSIPLHAQKLLTNPGKFANYQKIREEAANLLGLPPGYEGTESKYQQQQAGVPIKIGGKLYTVGVGLPLTSLNELPIGSPSQVLSNSADFFASMVTPIVKDPVEFGLNRSFFTHNDVQSDRSPLVAAPVWAKYIAKSDPRLAHTLGIVPDYIDSSGKKTWGWYGKSDYIAKILPGPFNILKQFTTPGTNRAGQGTAAKAVQAVSGIKPSLVDPQQQQTNDLYTQLDHVQRELAILSQRGIVGQHTNANRIALNAQAHRIEQQIYQLAQKRGTKLPSLGAPRKGRVTTGSSLGGGLGGGSLGGGLGGGLG